MRYIIVILLLIYSKIFYCQNLQHADSISRAKADIVLSYFESTNVSKLLYSIDDKYFYVLLKKESSLMEFVIVLDSFGNICALKEPTKLSRQDKKLLKETEPFVLINYDTNYITAVSNVEDFTFGHLAYFVIKDDVGKRFGEFRSFMPTANAPIDLKLWGYIIRKISEQLKLNEPIQHNETAN